MRAALVTAFNQDWELKDIPAPKPRAGQVLIKIAACGMCGTDLHVHHGLFPLKPPFVAGHEPVGEIVKLGEGVATLKKGDRVGVSWAQKSCGRCEMCQSQRGPLYCSATESWMDIGGGFSELMLAWAQGCTLLPRNISYEDAAPVFCAGYTVFSGLRNAGPRPGERVAVLGVGGLGHLALQYAKALGLETLALTSRADKKKELEAMGAEGVVLAGEDPGKALEDAGGADIVLSTTNSAKQIAQVLSRGLRPEGRFVNMGVADAPLLIDGFSMMLKQTRLIGSTQNHRRDLVEALDLVARGKVKPRVEAYRLSEINKARERLFAGAVRYRAVFSLS